MSLETIEAFFENIGKKILAFLGVLKTDAANAFAIGINLLSALINFIQSPEGTVIEDVIAKFIPATHVEEFLSSFLPTLFVDLKWASAEAGKTSAQIITDGLTYLASLTGTNKILQFTSAAASIVLWVASKLGLNVGTPQEVITAVPSAYATIQESTEAPTVDPHLSGKDTVAETVKDAIPADQATAEAGTEQAAEIPSTPNPPPASATGVESDTSNGAV